MCLKVFQNVTERFAHTIIKIGIEFVHNLRGYLDNTKWAELQQCLEFHAKQDKCIC